MSLPPPSARADQLAAAVRPVFEQAAVRDHVRGIAYGVVQDGVLAHAGGVGSVRNGTARVPGPDSRSRICSMTKSFLAAAVLMLRDRGKLRLDDPVAEYVPTAGLLRLPTSDSPVLTVGGLMSMAGGLPSDDAWADRQLVLYQATFARVTT